MTRSLLAKGSVATPLSSPFALSGTWSTPTWLRVRIWLAEQVHIVWAQKVSVRAKIVFWPAKRPQRFQFISRSGSSKPSTDQITASESSWRRNCIVRLSWNWETLLPGREQKKKLLLPLMLQLLWIKTRHRQSLLLNYYCCSHYFSGYWLLRWLRRMHFCLGLGYHCCCFLRRPGCLSCGV